MTEIEQCACARDYEWLPEHYTLAHHPRCLAIVADTSARSPQTATGVMIARAVAPVVERPDRQRVTMADVEFWERRHGDTVHVTAVLRLTTEGAYSVLERDRSGESVALALKRELAHRLIRAVYGDVWRLAAQVCREIHEAMLGYIPDSDRPQPSSELLDMGLVDD